VNHGAALQFEIAEFGELPGTFCWPLLSVSCAGCLDVQVFALLLVFAVTMAMAVGIAAIAVPPRR
jgi:hypothetical protein